MTDWVSEPCPVCGGPIWRPEVQSLKERRKYCSHKCAYADMSEAASEVWAESRRRKAEIEERME